MRGQLISWRRISQSVHELRERLHGGDQRCQQSNVASDDGLQQDNETIETSPAPAEFAPSEESADPSGQRSPQAATTTRDPKSGNGSASLGINSLDNEPADASTVFAPAETSSAPHVQTRKQQDNHESASSHSDTSVNLAFGSIGTSTALFAAPATVVTVFDVSSIEKMAWMVGLFVSTSFFGLTLFWWLLSRRRPKIQENTKARRLSLAFLIVTIVANMGLYVLMAGSVQWTVKEQSLTCLAPGAGEPRFANSFRDAYIRNGGREKLGCPISTVKSLAGGMHQNLSGPLGPGVIFAIDPGQAFALDADEWTGYHKIRGPVETSEQAGFPYDDGRQLAKGKVMELGGNRWPRTAIAKRNGGDWYWIQEGVWECYQSRFGGPEGLLGFGYPTGDQNYDERLRSVSQRFERGYLFYEPSRGLLTEDELVRGLSVDCATHSASVEIYKVNSSNGGIPHEIPPDKYVDQKFVATTGSIEEVGVIVGLDPNSDTGGPHELEIQLLTDDISLLSKRALLINNALTTVTTVPIEVSIGQVYTLRVYNRSRDTLGFYLNDPRKSGHMADPSMRAFLVGEKPLPEPHFDGRGALSGIVKGR